MIFAPGGGDGTLTIIREQSPGRYEVAGTVKTQASAKTIALDPETHRLYLSAASPEPASVGKAATKKGGRRRFAPGSFVVLVVGD